MDDGNFNPDTTMDIPKEVLFAETMNQIRHLGSLRFAILGVYSALFVGSLAITYTSRENSLTGLSTFGLLVSLIFGFFELYLSAQHSRLSERARKFEGEKGPLFEGRKILTFGPITNLTLLLYASSIAIWLSTWSK